MKTSKNVLCSLVFFILFITSVGCSSSEISSKSDILDVTKGVDIWSSMQYEIIRDLNTIKSIEPNATTDVLMIRFKIMLENRGSKDADEFQTNLNGPKLITYINSSMQKGIDKGSLKPNDTYEVSGYFTFESNENMNEFIEQSSLSIEWIEDQQNKSLNLRFPSEPTQER